MKNVKGFSHIYPPSRRRRGKIKLSTLASTVIFIGTIVVFLWLISLIKFHRYLDNQSIILHNGGKLLAAVAVADKRKSLMFKHEQAQYGIKSGDDGDNEDGDQEKEVTSDAFLTMYGQHRYQAAFDALPQWLQDYFSWHKEQTSKASSDIQYAIVTCLPEDDCGGVSDRLRPLLFYLFAAKQSNRVLCIHWAKHFRLEEYLQPISNVGIDWTCPREALNLYDLKRKVKEQSKVKLNKFGLCRSGKEGSIVCIRDNINSLIGKMKNTKHVSIGMHSRSARSINSANLLAQRYSYGRHPNGTFVMPNLVNADFPDMMENVFRVMFEPVPKLAQQINSTMAKLDLIENKYVSVHVRTRYPVSRLKFTVGNGTLDFDKAGGMDFNRRGTKQYLVSIMTNAIDCVNILSPNLKVLIATDHNDATNYAISNDFSFGKNANTHIVRPVGIHRDEEPPHVEGNHVNADFTSVFEDLLMMGGSKCVAHGIGSFGSFGAALAGNRCRAIHRLHNGHSKQCPNLLTSPDPVTFNSTEMLFEPELLDRGDNLVYDRSKYTRFDNVQDERY